MLSGVNCVEQYLGLSRRRKKRGFHTRKEIPKKKKTGGFRRPRNRKLSAVLLSVSTKEGGGGTAGARVRRGKENSGSKGGAREGWSAVFVDVPNSHSQGKGTREGHFFPVWARHGEKALQLKKRVTFMVGRSTPP